MVKALAEDERLSGEPDKRFIVKSLPGLAQKHKSQHGVCASRRR